jgi:predicted MFS family arabinose efflux permease
MISFVGVIPALLVDLGTFAVAALVYARLPWEANTCVETSERGRSGLRYVFSQRALAIVVGAFATATFATGLANATIPRFLDEGAGFGAHAYGFGVAAIGGGLVLGQVFVSFAPVGAANTRWIGLALLAMAGLLGLLGITEHGPSALLLLGAIGFLDGTSDVMFETIVQREARPAYLGAVFGIASALMLTTTMVSFAIAPVLNSLFPSGQVLLVGGVALAAAAAVALARPARRNRVVTVSSPAARPTG